MPASENMALTSRQAAARLREIRDRMAAAARKSGREAAEITLLGVSKTFPAASVRTYFSAGLADFGENYVQEAKDKLAELSDLAPAPAWHFIGHLQTNKAKYAARLFDVVHSVDNLELAVELDRRAQSRGRAISVYLQVNVSGEAAKSGLAPSDLPRLLEETEKLPNLRLAGLMTMPPYDPDPEASRPFFQALRELR
ncbi:MAG: YggS family pyridoxal phosphate-dependent enzyme, partial [Candidatus Adiutrix sp.]|nr:YggS family pyridoxal phosphate-dependent enzyme [Candidatus Adiutrix sp.]